MLFLRPELVAHPSGALLLPCSGTLIIADVHLGYSWAQRRRGELGPLADERTKQKLMQVVAELQPAQIVFLGDLVHAPRPCEAERKWIEHTLLHLSSRCPLVAVRGNHDRAFHRDFADLQIPTVDSWSDDTVHAVHGDQLGPGLPDDKLLVLGHLHPSMPVKDASGAGLRLPVFLASQACVVMPAFSPFARGYDLCAGLPEEVSGCFGEGEVTVFAASSTRVIELGPLDRVLRRMFEQDVSAPAQFRRFR